MEGPNIQYTNDFFTVFPLSEKNKYNNYIFKPIQIKKIDDRKIEIFYGTNKNNEKDVILLKKRNIDEKFIDEYYAVLKECILLVYLKNYVYFPKNVHIFLSENKQYLFIIIKENNVNLNILINSKFDYLNNKDLIKWIIYQIAFALYILHLNNIIHHDIKPSNILINDEGGVSLYDFGSAIFKGEDSYQYTLPYAPPELLIDQTTKKDEKIDMWGLGVIILELYLKISPLFQNGKVNNSKDQLSYLLSKLGVKEQYSEEFLKKELNDNKNIIFKIEELISDKIKDPEAIHLIKNLITFSPKNRYSAKEVLESDYLKEFRGLDSFDIKKIENSINKDLKENTLDKKKFIELIKKNIIDN